MPLNEDILPDIRAIARYIYNDDSRSKVRRLRHLIEKHNFPVKKVGGKIEGKKSWCDSWYAEPDARGKAA